jgi:hypothetical protein
MVKALGAFLAGVCLTLAGVWVSLPHCPSEDSCAGDYVHSWYGGHWTGKEQVP